MRSTYKQFYYINRGRVKADGTVRAACHGDSRLLNGVAVKVAG